MSVLRKSKPLTADAGETQGNRWDLDFRFVLESDLLPPGGIRRGLVLLVHLLSGQLEKRAFATLPKGDSTGDQAGVAARRERREEAGQEAGEETDEWGPDASGFYCASDTEQ